MPSLLLSTADLSHTGRGSTLKERGGDFLLQGLCGAITVSLCLSLWGRLWVLLSAGVGVSWASVEPT